MRMVHITHRSKSSAYTRFERTRTRLKREVAALETVLLSCDGARRMTSSRRGGSWGRKRKVEIDGQFAGQAGFKRWSPPAFRVFHCRGGQEVLKQAGNRNMPHMVRREPYAAPADTMTPSYGCRRRASVPALIEVEALGLPATTALGTRSFAIYRQATMFRLTYLHTADGPPSDEWKRSSFARKRHMQR